MKHTLVRGSMVLTLALSMGLIVASPAYATAVQTCKSLTGSVVLSPGLTTTPHSQTATASGKLATCAPTSKTGGSGAITAKLSLPSNSSCQGLVGGGQTIKLAATVKWKNGKSSKMSLTALTGKGSVAAAETAKITGKVTSGQFSTHKVATTIKITPKSGESCTPTSPIRHITFKNTKPFVIT